MDLNEIRTGIDRVDDEILALFLTRMGLSEQVAAAKKELGLPLLNKAREREILARMGEKAGVYEPYAYQLFSMLMELSKARQSELYAPPSQVENLIKKAVSRAGEAFPRTGTVACQGTEGGNSQAACDKLLPRGRILYVKSFESVCNAVSSGLCEFGVLPIENSANGSVRSVYELLQKGKFFVVRGASLCIRHELMALPGATLSGIKEIRSHEQAIGQCSRFLSSLGPGVRIVPCENTAMAAKQVADQKDVHTAAIASHPCAELYGLQVLKDDLQDSDNNYTRFILISREPVIYAGANRISLIIACKNQPGALNGVLSKLSAHGVNMSKLESCPVTGRNFEFMFFLELDASVTEPGVLPMLMELERSLESFTFLGNYALV